MIIRSHVVGDQCGIKQRQLVQWEPPQNCTHAEEALGWRTLLVEVSVLNRRSDLAPQQYINSGRFTSFDCGYSPQKITRCVFGSRSRKGYCVLSRRRCRCAKFKTACGDRCAHCIFRGERLRHRVNTQKWPDVNWLTCGCADDTWKHALCGVLVKLGRLRVNHERSALRFQRAGSKNGGGDFGQLIQASPQARTLALFFARCWWCIGGRRSKGWIVQPIIRCYF